jgi:hypothetical protein
MSSRVVLDRKDMSLSIYVSLRFTDSYEIRNGGKVNSICRWMLKDPNRLIEMNENLSELHIIY